MRPLFRFAALVLVSSLFAGTWPQAVQAQQGTTSPLVTRNQIHLQLKGAEAILAAAQQKATEMKLLVNIAIVDDGGNLLAFIRMDGARPGSGPTAITKATSAAIMRRETGPSMTNNQVDLHLSLSLQSAAAASGAKVTTLRGGVPIVVDNQVIGAVGVGGATGDQDAEIATAAIQSFVTLLGQNPKAEEE